MRWPVDDADVQHVRRRDLRREVCLEERILGQRRRGDRDHAPEREADGLQTDHRKGRSVGVFGTAEYYEYTGVGPIWLSPAVCVGHSAL